MAKQYRLKITWANGDSEYAGAKLEAPQHILDDALRAFQDGYPFYRISDKLFLKAHIRKIEFEEYIPEKEVRL